VPIVVVKPKTGENPVVVPDGVVVPDRVEPPKPKPVLPGDFAKADGAREIMVRDKPYWSRILDKRMTPPAVFVLIPSKGDDDRVPAFYIMENKVSQLQFRNGWKDPNLQKIVEVERAKHKWVFLEKWQRPDLAQQDRWPAFNVTVTEAYCFARWLGGDLPTVEQWKKAGGAFDGAPGPYEPGATKEELGLAREEPLPVDREAPKAVSKFGCRDMAGNGREFTRNVLNNPGKEPNRQVPLEYPAKTDRVYLLGQSFGNDLPFEFSRGKGQWDDSLGFDEASDTVGFRVVLKLNLGS